MKITVDIDPEMTEAEIVVRAADPEEANRLAKACAALEGHDRPPFLIGYRGHDATLLQLSAITRIATNGRTLEAHTATGTWRLKQRIGELATTLPSPPFLQISQGEIVNLRHVLTLDLSFSGTIGMRLDDGTTCFVSRRSLPAVRHALDL
ncbi:MAG: LytTR family DNA-binding domain-containing protein [Actinomycetaceae bacterium]|nr:LytTR family DNA-binding domain-containing protein [Actinomycetaceae bacterium]